MTAPKTVQPGDGSTVYSPQVSVVITCYNLGRYLDEAVDSVLTQSFTDFEILIVDDGSTDEETRRLLADYKKPKTRVLRSENRGLPAARNLGIANTTGPYLCMLDADDCLESTMLEKSVAALDDDPGLAFVSHWFRTFGDENWEWTPVRCDLEALLDANTVNGAALVLRSVMQEVGGFDESMREGFEDWDLWITLVERGFRGRILPEVLFNYRRRERSMSRALFEQDRYARLYRRLARKHEPSYRSLLPDLIVKRERELASVQMHVDGLDVEYHEWLEPAVAKFQDDVRVLEARVARHQRAMAANEEAAATRDALAGAVADRSRLQSDLGALGRELAGVQNLTRQLVADTERLQAEAIEREAELSRAEAQAMEHRGTLDRAEAHRARLEATSLSLAGALEVAIRRAHELDAAAHRSADEAAALRESLSWRVTAPLRRVFARVARLGGRKTPARGAR